VTIRLNGNRRTGVDICEVRALLDLDANVDGDVVLVDPLPAQTLHRIFYAQKPEELPELLELKAYLLKGFSC
jgi:hypothetical protein